MGLGKTLGGLEEFSGSLSTMNDNLSGVSEQGFTAPNVPGGDVGLPFTKVPYGRTAATKKNGSSSTVTGKRHLINWFVPDLGVVRMYVNPESIRYSYRKNIKPTRTKGGFSIQYWGEEMPSFTITGSTGSSGIEGINVLYEVYRSEQYTFDTVGLTLSSNNAAANLAGNLVSSISGSNNAGGIVSSLISPVTTDLSPNSAPSLANNALTVEMYYMGWVFRGYFENMEITEDTSLVFTYSMTFKVTQKRGYRTNFLPWQKTPIFGGGNLGNHYDEGYDQETGTGTSPQYSFIK
jgi:hypothetical protein